MYWQFMAFTLVQLLVLESLTVFQQIKSQQTLSQMCAKPYSIFVKRDDKWTVVSTEELVPGDLISVRGSKRGEPGPAQPGPAQGAVDIVPCDCLILGGAAVSNEATLTGTNRLFHFLLTYTF